MSVDEQARHELFNWFEEAMGPNRAATLMSLLPPVGWADIATKHDLLALERRFDEMDRHITTVATDVKAMQRSFVTWLFASQAVVVTVVGLFTALR